jgi:hypothetical protein
MVTFLPPAERYVGPEMIERLRVLNEDAARVNDRAWNEDRRVGMTVKYLQKVSPHTLYSSVNSDPTRAHRWLDFLLSSI